MKTIRRVIQIAICFLIIHSCSDDWINKGDSVKNDHEIKSEGSSGERIASTNKEGEKGALNIFSKRDEPLNVLIIGSDQRGTEASRADAIMVAQYNGETKSAKVMSIMRDSYVFIPGHGKSKINHAYSWGGETLLKETIEENFDIIADRVIKIDFAGFVSFIDTILPEGLAVEVTPEMINYWKWDMEPGQQVLNGQQLLNYVRFRKDDESDFGRVKRQQEVLKTVQQAIMGKLTTGEGIQTISSLIKEGKKAVETDLELGDLMNIGMTSMLNPVDSIESIRIPVKDTFKNVMTRDAGLVLELDAEANAAAAAKFFNNETQ